MSDYPGIDSVDWDAIPLSVEADDPRADDAPGCSFGTCTQQHAGARCRDCGKASSVTCLKKCVPAHIRQVVLDNFTADTFRCPECCWRKHVTPTPPTQEIDPDDASSEEETNAGNNAVTDTDTTSQHSFQAIMNKLDEMSARIDALEQRIDLTLPLNFAADVVCTWTKLEDKKMRLLVKDAVRAHFKTATIPAELSDAPDYEIDRARKIDSLLLTIDTLTDDKTSHPPTIKLLHTTVVELTSLIHLGVYGKEVRFEYEVKAKAQKVEKFEPHIMKRLLEEMKAKGKEAFDKKRKTRDDAHRASKSSGGKKGKGWDSRDRGGYREDRDRQRDTNREYNRDSNRDANREGSKNDKAGKGGN